MTQIRTLSELEALYSSPPTQRAIDKECDRITPQYARLIAASPFMIITSVHGDGLDCSPRGDLPGFVDVLDEKTLAIPDRPGNNRIDTLRNVVDDPRVGLIFLVPGVGECVRVRGNARITADPERLQQYAVKGKAPISLLEVDVQRVYFQCARAIIRSKLWNSESVVVRSSLPSAGDLLEDADAYTHAEAAAYDAISDQRLRQNLY